MKQKCCKCNHKAIWFYMPSGKDTDRTLDYYCDTHVSRGCSCNMEEDGTQPLDDKGREYPCCEYDYNVEGYDEEIE